MLSPNVTLAHFWDCMGTDQCSPRAPTRLEPPLTPSQASYQPSQSTVCSSPRLWFAPALWLVWTAGGVPLCFTSLPPSPCCCPLEESLCHCWGVHVWGGWLLLLPSLSNCLGQGPERTLCRPLLIASTLILNSFGPCALVFFSLFFLNSFLSPWSTMAYFGCGKFKICTNYRKWFLLIELHLVPSV